MRLGGRYLEPVESDGHQKQVPGPGNYPGGRTFHQTLSHGTAGENAVVRYTAH